MNIATSFAKHEAVRDSGTEWLGVIPSDWTVKKMKFLFRDHSRKGMPDAELLSVTQNQGVVPRTWVENRMVMPSGNLESFKFIEEGDFAISLRSFEGGLEYCHHDGIISPAYTVLKRRSEDLLPAYYRYLFKSTAFISELQTSVVGIREGKNISFEELSYSLIPIPPLPEQRAIAAFLDGKCATIDEAVRIKEEQIRLLAERRQILIQQAVTRGLNPDAPMKDSGIDWIGRIPAHWEVKRLRHLGTPVIGLTYDPKDLCDADEGTLVLRSSNLQGGRFTYGDDLNVYVSMRIPEKLKIKRDDILICSRNGSRDLIGKCALATEQDCGASFGAFTTVFRSPINRYLFQILNSEIFKLLAGSFLTATINQLTTSNLNSIYVPVPPPAEQAQLTDYLETLNTKVSDAIALKGSQISALREYKTSLINAAVTGKIKVL